LNENILKEWEEKTYLSAYSEYLNDGYFFFSFVSYCFFLFNLILKKKVYFYPFNLILKKKGIFLSIKLKLI
jgi:hypothetical protein